MATTRENKKGKMKFIMTAPLDSDVFDKFRLEDITLAVMTAVDEDPEISLIEIDKKLARSLRRAGVSLKRAKAGRYIDYETDRVVRVH